MPRPTINDVARAAGVSKGAVSFALNDRPGVAPETRERILEVARRLGWTPSTRARALAASKALAVGLVVARAPETLRADPFFPAFIAGLETVLAERGHALVLHFSHHHVEDAYRRLADEGRVDGVFLTDLLVDDVRPAVLSDLGLPAVVVGPPQQGSPWPAVGIDDAAGIRQVVDHLLALGHTSIAHVAGPQSMVHAVTRREAWVAALREGGVRPGPWVEAGFSAESGAAATRHLLDLPERPTAIVFAHDLTALAGMSLALSRGLDVPGDLSVAGFDDSEIAAHLQPPLTTVATDVLGWGRAAATSLLDLIDGRPPAPVDLPPARLVVRGSTGPAPRHRTSQP